MVRLTDIYSLTDFLRNAREHLRQMKETGRPRALTVNGKAEVVVQDAKSYQRLLDLVERAEAIQGIRQGLEQMQRGDSRPAGETLTRVRAPGPLEQCPSIQQPVRDG